VDLGRQPGAAARVKTKRPRIRRASTEGNVMGNEPRISQPKPSGASHEAIDELRAIRRELVAIRRLFDHFAGVFLNSKFPHGKPYDKWTRQ
jgi:hypothetical protein